MPLESPALRCLILSLRHSSYCCESSCLRPVRPPTFQKMCWLGVQLHFGDVPPNPVYGVKSLGFAWHIHECLVCVTPRVHRPPKCSPCTVLQDAHCCSEPETGPHRGQLISSTSESGFSSSHAFEDKDTGD